MKKNISFFLFTGFMILFYHHISPEGFLPQSSDVHFGFFYSSLARHGGWIELRDGLRVWRPLHINRNWQPYLAGRWAWTDYGWYWISDEPFGWIVYHYGRWYYDDFYGWIWIPDNEWGPAWVEWRCDDEYIGWAPLPPYAVFRTSIGLHFTRPWNAPVHYWCFIRYNQFSSPIHHNTIVPWKDVKRFFGNTSTYSKYTMENDHIMNRGIDPQIIESQGNLRMNMLHIQERAQGGEQYYNNPDGQKKIEIHRLSRAEFELDAQEMNIQHSDRQLSTDMYIARYYRNPDKSSKPIQRAQREDKQRHPTSFNRQPKEMRHNLMERYNRNKANAPTFNRRDQKDRSHRGDEFGKKRGR